MSIAAYICTTEEKEKRGEQNLPLKKKNPGPKGD